MTFQEAYDGIREYFSRPGAVQAVDDGGDCFYRVPGTNFKCAVGCLIPDEQYEEVFDRRDEMYPLGAIVSEVWPEHHNDEDFIVFLSGAQHAHDGADNVAHFLERLDSLARRYHLRVPS